MLASSLADALSRIRPKWKKEAGRCSWLSQSELKKINNMSRKSNDSIIRADPRDVLFPPITFVAQNDQRFLLMKRFQRIFLKNRSLCVHFLACWSAERFQVHLHKHEYPDKSKQKERNPNSSIAFCYTGYTLYVAYTVKWVKLRMEIWISTWNSITEEINYWPCSKNLSNGGLWWSGSVISMPLK